MHRLRKTIATLFVVALSAQTALLQERVFFGNLHSHTSFSDGSGTPREAYTHARDVARLDFLALTEHNHREAMGNDGIGIAANHALYKASASTSLISTARSMTVNDRFVAIYGQEFSTISSGNHMNVFEIGEVIEVVKGRFDLLRDFLAANQDSTNQPAIIMFNHPDNSSDLSPTEYGLDDFADPSEWLCEIGKHARLIQMINGPGQSGTGFPPARPDESAYRKFLNFGFKLAPTADQDNHQRNWGDATDARTAVVVTSLTKANVLDALRRRHVYATEDKNLSVIIKVNGRLCGDVIAPLPSPGELNITFSISDPDESDAEYEIQVWRDSVGGPTAKLVSSVIRTEGTGQVEDVAFSGEAQYFYFKVIQRDEDGNEDRVWTAPVWFENQLPPGDVVPAGAGTSNDESRFVASKKSEVFHSSDECLDAKRIKPSNLIRGPNARRGRRLHEGCPRCGIE